MKSDPFTHQRQAAEQGISFPVHDVEPGVTEVPEVSMLASLEECMRSGMDFLPEVVAVSDAEGRYLQLPSQNGFLAAVHLAFSHHLPLTLSPDIIWLAILQGFARHVKVHAKELEDRWMASPGKHTIQITVGSSEWDWPTVFDQFCKALETHARDPRISNLQADFSTTGKIERAASQVALMDVFSPYVHYVVYCVCGIPSITLKGSESDWIRLREKLALLRGYDADDWIEEIDGILARFVDASRGEVDRGWWQQIYKLHKRYGGNDIEGWLGAFFPYLRDEQRTFTRPRKRGEIFTTEIVPPGLSDVAIKFATVAGSESLRIVSGFVGVENLGPDGVMPKIGWAVVRNHFMESFADNLERYAGIKTKPPVEAFARTESPRSYFDETLESLPIDLQLFYRATDGAELFGKGIIHSSATLLQTGTVDYWKHLGLWRDGSLLLIDNAVVRLRWTDGGWEHQTLGRTFGEFMARLIGANGHEYWKDSDFIEPEITPSWITFDVPSPVEKDLVQPLHELRRQNGRLRSMKVVRHDVFVIRSASGGDLSHLPSALRLLYKECDGVQQVDGFDLWPASRVCMLPNTQGRWFEVGAAPGFRIIFDIAAARGVAVIDEQDRRVYQIASSFEEFFLQAAKAPTALYWAEEKKVDYMTDRPRGTFWPDERVEF